MLRSTAITILFLCVFMLSAVAYVPPARAASPGINDPAPDFALPDMQGITRKISDYRGKVVVLNFWATWCPECIHEMPSLDNLYGQLKNDGLVVLGISIDRSRNDIEQMGAKVSYPLLLDEKGDVFVKKFTVTRLPETIVINRDGTIVDMVIGSRDFASAAFIEKMTDFLHGKSRP